MTKYIEAVEFYINSRSYYRFFIFAFKKLKKEKNTSAWTTLLHCFQLEVGPGLKFPRWVFFDLIALLPKLSILKEKENTPKKKNKKETN